MKQTDLSPILQTAKELLSTVGRKGMHVLSIAEAAVAQNKNMGLDVESFCKKVSGALAANLKLKSNKPTFAKVNWDKGPRKGKPKQGWYRLKSEKIAPVVESVHTPKTDKAFLGKAGEYAVMSELLFWGFNASIMSVDDGIDIVATKNNKFFHIQVKTATRQDAGKYQFTINPASFKKYHATNVFYVFVLRHGIKNDFIIIPSSHIKYLVDKGVISENTAMSLTIAEDAKKSDYLLNNKESVKPFYGNFGELVT